jgi:tetratricopeptide (TPR) repeat protein
MRRVSERLEKLQKMLEREPNDAFLLYGIAMEHKKLNDAAAALEFFDRVTRLDPGYCYAYHQKGLVHELQGDTDAAKAAYREGIDAAIKKGDDHARGEIEAALSMID